MNISEVPKEQGGPRRKVRNNLEECFRKRWGRGRSERVNERQELWSKKWEESSLPGGRWAQEGRCGHRATFSRRKYSESQSVVRIQRGHWNVLSLLRR